MRNRQTLREELKSLTASVRRRLEGSTSGPWYVATGCSWRRILRTADDAPVLLPTRAKDGQWDLDARMNDLELMANAREDLARLCALAEELLGELPQAGEP